MSKLLLAAVDADRSEPVTLDHAADLARTSRGQITIVCAWRPTRLLPLTVLAEHDPVALAEEHARHAAAWLRRALRRLPSDVSVSSICREGPLVRHVSKELCERHYDELIVDPALGARGLARIRRAHPDLRVRNVSLDSNAVVFPDRVASLRFG